MAWAADDGNENIVRVCREWEATDIEKTLIWATSGGHKDILRLCGQLSKNYISSFSLFYSEVVYFLNKC